MINIDRLKDTFATLVSIDSESKQEQAFALALREKLDAMGAHTVVDDAGRQIGSNTGNLIAKLSGTRNVRPLLLSAHMDTVAPGKEIQPIFKGGVFSSAGDTILGADDKSAIAIILETLQLLKEKNVPHGPLELVFTVCEELALDGAKHLDFNLITATQGYALDASDTGGIITRAPAANRFTFQVFGKEAHAGAAPEKGINAITLASKAIASLELGRIDPETTCNIGMIQGGLATNIVPNRVQVVGEVRSHSEAKLKQVTETITAAFKDAVDNYSGMIMEDALPSVDTLIVKSFSRTNIPKTHGVVTLATRAAQNLGRELICKASGGGSDANIFFEKGIMVGVLGTGMHDVHTLNEWIRIDDMARMVELLLEIIKEHAKKTPTRHPAGEIGGKNR